MVKRLKCGSGNCYVVNNGKDAILIDTGKKEYLNQIIKECKPYTMRLIVLTHVHMDHAENAEELSNIWGCPVAVNKKDIELAGEYESQPLVAKTLLGKIILGVSRSVLQTKFFIGSNLKYVEEGETLKEYGIDATIIELPGHTNGSIGVDVERKDFIVGDALMNWFRPTVSQLYHNRELMLESAKRIQDMGERTIYFGHGKPASNRAFVKEK